MHAKSDRYRPHAGEHVPQPFDFHSHEVQWQEHGFTIVKRCYCVGAAQFEAKFQRRMGNDARVIVRSN